MIVYVVERDVRGLSAEQLATLHRAVAESARRLSVGGESVRYLRSLFASEHARCLCVFEATSKDLVRRVNEVAQAPFKQIEEAISFEDPGHRPEA